MQDQIMKVDYHNGVLRITFNSPDGTNKINMTMVSQLWEQIITYESRIKIIVLEGNKDYFCSGADFADDNSEYHPERLYELWYRLATGPFITVSYVMGKVTAGGMGFIGASDIVIADVRASFALTELLFGLYPAIVFPFLSRRIGFAAINYMTMTTGTLTAEVAAQKGIVDVCGESGNRLLGQHLARLTKIPKTGITAYKGYVEKLDPMLRQSGQVAIDANREMFRNKESQKKIHDFLNLGKYPWES